MFNELFDDDAYDLRPSKVVDKSCAIQTLVSPLARTEYAINYRDASDNNARQIVSAVGELDEIEKKLIEQVKSGVITFMNNDHEVVILPVSRLLDIEIFPPKEWR